MSTNGQPLRGTVLIVDDERSVRRTLGEFLRELHYDVAEADDVESAWSRVSAGGIGVVVTDVVLPRVSGVELLMRIRKIVPEIPVVMMTGNPTLETARDSIRLGAVDYLVKPINKDGIQRAVANAMRLRGLEDAKRGLEAENRRHREGLEDLVRERTAQLQSSEARARGWMLFYQGTMDALRAHICVLDSEGVILGVNRAWREFAAANPPAPCEAWIGANYLTVCDGVHGKDAPQAREVAARMRDVLGGRLPEYACEYPCHSPDRQRWFSLSATRIDGDDQMRLVVAHEDITQRRRTQQELRDSEALFQSLVQNIPHLVYRKDREGRFTFVNDVFCRTVGRPRGEIIGYQDCDLFPEPYASKYRADDLRVIEHGETVEEEEEGPGGNGASMWMTAIKTPLRNADGDVVGVQGISWDITRRRRAEMELRMMVRAVEQSPAAILITNHKGEIEFVNPKCVETSGYTFEEVKGRNPRVYQSGEANPETYRQLWAEISAGREWRGEFRNRRKDGTLYWESASISAVRDADGEITHFIAVKENITERKDSEARVLRAQRVESLGHLIGGIAHDLNNILAPIVMCAPLMGEELTSQERSTLAETMRASAERAVGMMRQLLVFVRGSEGKRAPVQLRSLIREVAGMMRETLPRSIQVTDVVAAGLPPVLGDATQFHQILLNLCVNARDAMPDGGRLKLRASNVEVDEHFAAMHPGATKGLYVRIEVEDTGTGIPETAREHMFEPFFTTKAEGAGTGLGLATVAGIARQHGGFVTFQTVLNQGTTFAVFLPAAPDAPGATLIGGPPKPARTGRGELILVVDDEPAIRETAKRALESHGYAVLLAHDGSDGLARFVERRGEIRAVLTDIMMPRMDGSALCRALRAIAPDIPLIVSTGELQGMPGRESTRMAAEFKALRVLQKPHTADLVLEALGELLGTPEAGGMGDSTT